MSKLHSITYVRNRLGVSAQTIRNYIKTGKIEATQMPNGRYYFTDKQINDYFKGAVDVDLTDGENADKTPARQKVGNWAFYVRSSDGDKVHLANQEKFLRENYSL